MRHVYHSTIKGTLVIHFLPWQTKFKHLRNTRVSQTISHLPRTKEVTKITMVIGEDSKTEVATEVGTKIDLRLDAKSVDSGATEEGNAENV